MPLHRLLFFLLLVLGRCQSPAVPLEQLLQVLALELQSEDTRPSLPLLPFLEFQDVSDLDCGGRLAYLLNETLSTQRRLAVYQGELLGRLGLFQQVLSEVPQENTWAWLVARAEGEVLAEVRSHFSKVVAQALDQHGCFLKKLRDVVLESLVQWRKLHAELAQLQWRGLAGLEEARPGGQLAGGMWAAEAAGWFAEHARRVLGALAESGAEEAREGAVRLHHQDEQGSFVTYEFLRRKVFGQWAIDKGLLRALLRHVFWREGQAGGDANEVSLADFGAGGGHYSSWLNDTGLVQAFAFDGTQQAAELTGGVVQEVNLVAPELRLWRNFTWVLCLEVGEHIPRQFSQGLLQNLRRHAVDGLVMSWSDDWEGIGHVNCLSRQDFVAFVERETGFRLDDKLTELVREACEIDYISRTVAVFRSPQAS